MSDASENKHCAYLFEAKGIQSFLGESGRLVDIIGGSELVASIAASDGEDLLAEVLVGFKELSFSRRAGASFCLHSEDLAELEAFRDSWLLAFGLRAPGLAYIDVLTAGHCNAQQARIAAYATQGGVRRNSTAASLPLARPGITLARRTGRPAVAQDTKGAREPLDSTVNTTRLLGRRISSAAGGDDSERLVQRVLGGQIDVVLPRHFQLKDAEAANPAFPFVNEADDRRVGLVHADISGLGQLFIDISQRLKGTDEILLVAKTIEAVIQKAAQKASEVILGSALTYEDHERAWRKHFGYGGSEIIEETPMLLPMRPVLLGGDDLMIIVRADLALRFAERFLIELENVSETELDEIWDELGVQDDPPCSRLSACAGVAIVNASSPYLMASQMAETMCDHAKIKVKAEAEKRSDSDLASGPASAITFAVVSTVSEENYAEYRDRELQLDGVELTATPYLVGKKATQESELIEMGVLWDVAKELKGLGGLQGLRRAVHSSPQQMKNLLLRVAEVASIETPVAFTALIRGLEGRLSHQQMDETTTPLEQASVTLWKNVGLLNDALELLDISAVFPTDSGDPKRAGDAK